MVNMRIIFCDDDPAIPRQLQKYLTEFFQKSGLPKPQYQSFSSGEELLLDDGPIDIAFLDVEMPGISGIVVGSKLKVRNPYVKIFIVTSYQEHLDEAMKCCVFRYFTKPVERQRLFRNMKDALYQYNPENKKIPIETKDSVTVKQAEEIICVESTSRKVIVHTCDGSFESVRSMEYWVDMLNLKGFFQTYRSFIVNMKYVASFNTSTVHLLTESGFEMDAYLARRRYKEFKDTYLLYLESMK